MGPCGAVLMPLWVSRPLANLRVNRPEGVPWPPCTGRPGVVRALCRPCCGVLRVSLSGFVGARGLVLCAGDALRVAHGPRDPWLLVWSWWLQPWAGHCVIDDYVVGQEQRKSKVPEGRRQHPNPQNVPW